MANKKKPYRARRRAFNLRTVRTSTELPVLTLATDTAKTVGLTGVSANRYRVKSVHATITAIAMTSGDGPLTVGYAHSDYSLTEIKESLEAFAAIDQGDKVAQEQANRLVRIVGSIAEFSQVMNDGKPIKTKLNWLIGIGDEVNLFIFNENTASFTTGCVVNCQGNLWIQDRA